MKPEVDNPGKLTARLLAACALAGVKLVEEIVAESAPLDPAEWPRPGSWYGVRRRAAAKHLAGADVLIERI